MLLGRNVWKVALVRFRLEGSGFRTTSAKRGRDAGNVGDIRTGISGLLSPGILAAICSGLRFCRGMLRMARLRVSELTVG